MAPTDKPLIWLRGEVKTPPFSATARLEAGWLLRRLQAGEMLGMPHSRPMPSIGQRCHELRVVDAGKTLRISPEAGRAFHLKMDIGFTRRGTAISLEDGQSFH